MRGEEERKWDRKYNGSVGKLYEPGGCYDVKGRERVMVAKLLRRLKWLQLAWCGRRSCSGRVSA